jgi:hypothetical protein
MTPIIDIHLVSEAIRDAVAPVFLLTGIGSILNVMVGRLGRAIDFATSGALLVCVSIASLFVSVESGFSMPHMVLWSFISSMGAIIVALLCFLRERLLTSNEAIISSNLALGA